MYIYICIYTVVKVKHDHRVNYVSTKIKAVIKIIQILLPSKNYLNIYVK